jgi:hypothetical protein
MLTTVPTTHVHDVGEGRVPPQTGTREGHEELP